MTLVGGVASSAERVDSKGVQELSVLKLLAEIERSDDLSTDPHQREALAQRAASLLLSSDVWDRGEYATIRRLVEAAEPALASLSEEP